jgi:hypothetical protein
MFGRHVAMSVFGIAPSIKNGLRPVLILHKFAQMVFAITHRRGSPVFIPGDLTGGV